MNEARIEAEDDGKHIIGEAIGQRSERVGRELDGREGILVMTYL